MYNERLNLNSIRFNVDLLVVSLAVNVVSLPNIILLRFGLDGVFRAWHL